MPNLTRTSIVTVLTILLSGIVSAQSRPAASDDPDGAELLAYRLTLPTLQKMMAATQAFKQAIKNDPKFKAYAAAEQELETLNEKENPTPAEQKRIEELEKQTDEMSKELDSSDDSSKNESLSDMERTIAKVPHLAESITSAGMTPREYTKFTLVLFQASFAAGLKKSGQLKELPAGIRPENVQFVLDHEKELTELGKQLQSMK